MKQRRKVWVQVLPCPVAWRGVLATACLLQQGLILHNCNDRDHLWYLPSLVPSLPPLPHFLTCDLTGNEASFPLSLPPPSPSYLVTSPVLVIISELQRRLAYLPFLPSSPPLPHFLPLSPLLPCDLTGLVSNQNILVIISELQYSGSLGNSPAIHNIVYYVRPSWFNNQIKSLTSSSANGKTWREEGLVDVTIPFSQYLPSHCVPNLALFTVTTSSQEEPRWTERQAHYR